MTFIKRNQSAEISPPKNSLYTKKRHVEKAAEEGSGVVLSETVGDHTVHFADGAGLLGLKTGSNTGKTQSELEYEIIAKYLMSSGLMYRGVDL